MSKLTVGQLRAANQTTKLITLASGDTVYSPGSVVQVINTTLVAPSAVGLSGQSNFVNVPSFAASITPKSASSRIYITARWFGESAPQTANWDTTFGLKRNGSVIGQNPNASGFNGISMAALSYYADDGNSTPEMMYLDYWDTPSSTSLLTYQLYAVAYGTSTLYTNRTVAASSSNFEYGSSTITLWEIAQ